MAIYSRAIVRNIRPETRSKCVAKPRRNREKGEEIGAEYSDPEEQHGADGLLCDVNDPKDEPNVNQLC